MSRAESEIRALMDARSEAIHMKDIDRLMALYAPDVVYFDVVPPLRYAGADALHARFSHWFEGWEGPIRQQIHDLTVLSSGDVAAAHMLIQAGGTRKNGPEAGFWVRASNSCRRLGNRWLITHEHISLPVDLTTQRAATDLAP